MDHKRKKPAESLRYRVEAPATLLSFLLETVKGKSRNNIKSMLTRGQVAVDGHSATQFDQPLAAGQEVAVAATGGARVSLPFPLLYEDEHLICVSKPVGLLTMATETEKERTAYRQVTEYVRGQNPEGRIFIVHRLDKETSGVLIFAKVETTKRTLQDNWDTLVLRRGYQAVTDGVPKPPEGTVRSQLRETSAHSVYSVRSGGKEAVTHYKVLRDNGDYALVDITIDTGRKNQIRVHLGDLGYPVAGDRKYGGRRNPIGRLCLHAHELILNHPVTGAELVLRAETPREFRRLTANSPSAGAPAGEKKPARGKR